VSENEDKGISIQADWQGDNFLLTSITAYREHDIYDEVDADFLDVDSLVRINEAQQDQFSQELRISNSAERFNYVAGVYYYQQHLDSQSDTIVGPDTAFTVGLGAAPNDPFPAGASALNVTSQEHESYAVFGQLDYNVSESFVITAGLRWTFEEKDLSNVFTEDASPTAVPGSAPGWGFYLFDPLAPKEDSDEKIDDDQVTGTLKLSWFMNDRTMFYASYGTGYKSGGINTDRINPALSELFDAETSESFELGMKADFPDQALRVNVALHKTDTDDLQTISFQGTGFSLQNAGVAETYGGELDLTWLPTDNTTVTIAYAYNHAEYADFERGDCWIGTPWHTGLPDPGANGDGSCDRSGGDVSSNPENVFVITANQLFRLTDSIGGFAYAEYIFTDERMTDVDNDPVKYDGSFSNINLRLGVLFEDWDTTLTAWGRNITDSESTNTIASAVAQDGRFNAFYNEPATWGITLRKEL